MTRADFARHDLREGNVRAEGPDRQGALVTLAHPLLDDRFALADAADLDGRVAHPVDNAEGAVPDEAAFAEETGQAGEISKNLLPLAGGSGAFVWDEARRDEQADVSPGVHRLPCFQPGRADALLQLS